ncbi:MAG: hypothetical protein K2X93_17000 [Candidatus Obscuribacterales bacterium]|nr:hypothetical protein [Candidatus Obscuribacterales bacterium]
MSLSTFNFKTLQIPILQITILVALTVAYHCTIVGTKAFPGNIHGPFKFNIKKIEKYERSHKPAEAVALGSSILNRPMEQLGPEYRNFESLCLVGSSALHGAAVIKHSKRYPKVAVIELSMMMSKAERLDIEAEVPRFKAMMWPLTPIVRCEYQPSALLLRYIQENVPQKHEKRSLSVRESREFAFRRIPGTGTSFRDNLARLRKKVRQLQRHGTRVCFIFVPQSPTREMESLFQKRMKVLNETFPPQMYQRITWSGPHRKWSTPDGWHLSPADARLFADDMLKQLKPIWQSAGCNIP